MYIRYLHTFSLFKNLILLKKLQILLTNRMLEKLGGLGLCPVDLSGRMSLWPKPPLRILKYMANLTDVYLEQVAAFGEVARFPHSHTITVGYYALVNPS